MDKVISDHRFEFGDRVRHVRRPEWGVGSVTKTEDVTVSGQPFQRITVRFPNAGVKRLVSGHALLQRVESSGESATTEQADAAPVQARNGDGQTANVREWDRLRDSDWLNPLAERKVREAMTTLPEEIRDPFNSLRKRLAATLSLYRFDRSGRGLIDWAVAQSGLADPLSRFNRHELEQMFDRWAVELDQHLSKLLQAAKVTTEDRQAIREIIQSAPRSARDAVQRVGAMR